VARRCAVLGSPIAHSLSPVMHRAAYDTLGLDWTYDAIEVDEAGLPGFLAGLDATWRGLSLTMPLKRAVLPLLDTLSATAATVRVVNTVVFDEGRRSGDNTDVPGVVAALAERGITGARRAAVLGTGATAASAIIALARLGVRHVLVVGRRVEAASALAGWAGSLGLTAEAAPLAALGAGPTDIVVSTVPADALAAVADQLIAGTGVVLDVTYDPWPSPLLLRAEQASRVTVSGVDLLAHQAVLQVGVMTGCAVAVDVLRDAAHTALGSRP